MTAGDAAAVRAVLELAFAATVGYAAWERWPGNWFRLVLACAGAWLAIGLVRALGAT